MRRSHPVANTSIVRLSFNQLFLISFILFFQYIPIWNAILRRFSLCHFLAKRHSLGVTCIFFNVGSIKSIFHQTLNHRHVRIFVLIPWRAKRVEGTSTTITSSSTLTGPKTTTSNFENGNKVVKKRPHFWRVCRPVSCLWRYQFMFQVTTEHQ